MTIYLTGQILFEGSLDVYKIVNIITSIVRG